MLAVYAINEHSKHDLTNTIQYLWVFVALGGVICAWQTTEVLGNAIQPF